MPYDCWRRAEGICWNVHQRVAIGGGCGRYADDALELLLAAAASLSSSCLPGGRVGAAAHMFMYKGMLVARDNDSYMASSLKP